MVGWVRGVGGVFAVGWLLAGCEKAPPAAGVEGAGLEEVRPAAGEGMGGAEGRRALALGVSQALRAAVAPNGDVLLAADYERPVSLGGKPLPFEREVSGPHMLVARLSSQGELRWAQGLVPAGTGAVRAQVGAVAVEPEGGMVLAGTSAGFQLGGAWLAEGPFLARLSPEGRLDWTRSFPGEGPFTVTALAVEPSSGELVMTGDFGGRRDFGTGPLSVPVDRFGAFVARFSAAGEPRWSRALGGLRGDVSARAVAVDAEGDILVAGGYSGAVSFGGATFATVLSRTPYLLKLSPEGRHRWSHDVTGAEGTAQAVAVGPERVFVSGTYTGRFFFQSATFQSDWQDGFLIAYDPQGHSRWARSFAASATALATDGAGQVLVAGEHDGGRDWEAGGSSGLYVSKLLPEDGTSVWSRGYASRGEARAHTLGIDATGQAHVAGSLVQARGPGQGPSREGFLLPVQP
ncbi:hypothetical protein SAMN05444354_11788 [Stigmatella aurantiaca]|uniref:Lipoprotein n=1 Tax=Stigmatella aurantiaca TaxID=41 RepID=A0A1H7YMZ3_STIAU|nr:hypothetical protein [Stigmatella aurantiaca]SEM47480.1 hypothetical protein SAMN05444354_11788 [Stigmatella aurantiaca]